ncbi:MAG: glycosyltransferase [Candidatus Omnitrophota bacterium]
MHKRITWLVCGNFNGYLDDGGTNSTLTLLRELQKRGASCSVQVFLGLGSVASLTAYVARVRDFAHSGRIIIKKGYVSFYVKNILIEARIVKENIFKLYHTRDEKALRALTLHIKAILRMTRPDIIITSQEDIFSLRAADESGIPCCHIFSSACFKFLDTFNIYKNEFRACLAKTLVVTCSCFLKRDIRNIWNKRAILLPALIDRISCVAKKRNPRYITFVNCHPHKGAVIFWNIARKLPHKRFLVIDNHGFFPLKSPLKNVTVLRRQSDMKKVYRLTKILLFPSLVEESYGMVLVEAMANGIPVIANRIEGIKNTLQKAGFLVDINQRDKDKKDYFYNSLYHMKTYQQYVALITMLDSDSAVYNKASKKALQEAERIMSRQRQALEGFADLIAKR